jgi:hypothetical protein
VNRRSRWLVASFLALSSRALAGAPVKLVYEAPAECPAQPEFVAAVAARGGDFDHAGSAGTHRVLVVAITKDDRGFAGAFQVRDDGTASDRREVHGQSCAEVTDALSVVAAIALRSDAASAAVPIAAVAPPPPPAATPAPNPPGAKRFVGHTAFFSPSTKEVLVSSGTLRFDRQQAFGISAGAVAGLVPTLLIPHYDFSGTVVNFVTMPDGSQRIDGSVTKVRVSALGPATYRSPSTTTSLAGFSFGISLCGSPHYDTRGLVLLICGEYGGGLMHLVTKGTDGSQIQSKNTGFGTLALEAQLQYNLGPHFFVQANVSGGGTVGDISAEHLDGTPIFGESSLWGHWLASGDVGLGLHF